MVFSQLRRLLVLAAGLAAFSLASPPAFSGNVWEETSLTDAGFQSGVGDSLDAAVAAEKLPNLHGVVVARNGKLVLERYYDGLDERRGRSLGQVRFDAATKHDLRSVSKSIVSLLYGIALDAGQVPALNASLVDGFPEYEDLAKDPERRRMTVSHALTMRMGTAWDESLPYTDPRNSETAMDYAPDRYRFILEQPFATEPGTQWNYNGGATALLARLIERGSDRSILEFAREVLFTPLGIEDVDWNKDRHGKFVAASGLRLRPRDLAKIGQLVLDRGRWKGEELIPEAWLNEAFTPRTQTGVAEFEYGYQWWLGRMRSNGKPWLGAFGNGGQRLIVIPHLELVVVVTAGNYNQPDAWKLSVAIMGEHLLPALLPY